MTSLRPQQAQAHHCAQGVPSTLLLSRRIASIDAFLRAALLRQEAHNPGTKFCFLCSYVDYTHTSRKIQALFYHFMLDIPL